MNATAGIRLQKLIATAGLASRRGAEDWLRAGRVSLNGRVAQLGDRAIPGDVVLLDGAPLELGLAVPVPVLTQLLLYHKPIGEVTTRSDPQGRPTVFERLPPPATGRWVVIGRLDVNTSGLLLFTNDGELAHRYMHPSSELEREYLVRVRGAPDTATLQRLRSGLRLDDGVASFERIEARGRSPGHSHFVVVLREGRNREVRRLWQAAGFEVSRLMRLKYGPLLLPDDLPAGGFRLADAPTLARAVAVLGSTGSGRERAQ
ncbi:MAG: pseudouridine synthase [Steroidobacteraceae bacterium]